MSVGQTMTMRASVLRNETTINKYGLEGPPEYKEIDSDLHCRIWESENRFVIGEVVFEAGDPKMVCKKTADIQKQDLITDVVDRNGNDLFTKLEVRSVVKRKNHMAVGLKKIG